MTIQEHYERALLTSPRPVILEIGAAHGEDTEKLVKIASDIAANNGSDYEYYAVEPDPRNLSTIKDKRVNHFIHLIPVAVGDKCTRTTFNQSGGTNPQFGYEHTLSGSLKKPTLHLQAHPWCKFDKSVEVRMVTLDTLFDFLSINIADFIWCDVQGAEDLVIAGGKMALGRTRYLYTEYHSTPLYECAPNASDIALMLGSHWKVVQQWQHDVLFENTCYKHQ